MVKKSARGSDKKELLRSGGSGGTGTNVVGGTISGGRLGLVVDKLSKEGG